MACHRPVQKSGHKTRCDEKTPRAKRVGHCDRRRSVQRSTEHVQSLKAAPRLQEGVVVGWTTVCRAEDGPRGQGLLGGIARGSCRAIRCTQVNSCVCV